MSGAEGSEHGTGSWKRLPDTRIALVPKAVVIVTSLFDGEMGATTIAWNGVLSSQPPILAVSFLPDSYCRSRIEGSREFVVNVPGVESIDLVETCGAISGPLSSEEYPGIELAESDEILSPRLGECYLALECRLLQSIRLGLYDCYLGLVLAMHSKESVYSDLHPRGSVDYEVAQPLLCFGDRYWTSGEPMTPTQENKDHPYGDRH